MRNPRPLGRHRLSQAVILCTLLFGGSLPLPAQQPKAAQQLKRITRWAVIGADGPAGTVADLLTAELSGLDNIQLVERDQIRRVLDELELKASGLAQRDRAARFGQLSQADALVIINTAEGSKPRQQDLRLRLIDTRSSIRLLDALLPSSSIDDEITAICEELQAATSTLSIPSDQLHMFGVLPIISGEPGHLLHPYCRTLTALVAAEFHRRPDFVLLERSDLQRLTAESDLSGLELNLRGATRLLETSVRRTADGEGIVATCQIVSPDGGASASTEINVPSREPIAARSLVVQWVLENVGNLASESSPVSPEQEAQTLDRRTHWLRGEDSVAMAEAAWALAPTRKRLERAVGVNAKLAYDRRLTKTQNLGALIAYQRWAELRLQYLKSYPATFAKRTLFPIYLSFAKPFAAVSEEEQQLVADISNLRQEILQLEYQSTSQDALARVDTILQMIDLQLRWKPSTPNPAILVKDLLQEAFSLCEAAGIARDLSDPYFNELIRMLVVTIDVVSQASSTDSGPAHLRVDNFENWVSKLLPLDRGFVSAATLRARTALTDPRGQQAARDLVAVLHQLPLVDTKYVDLPLRRVALLKIPPNEAFRYFQRMLDRSEQNVNPMEVLVFGTAIKDFLNRLSADQATQLARRMIRMLQLEHEANTMFTTTPMLVELSKFVPKSESPFRLLPEFSLENALGPWQQYRVKPIRLNVDGKRRVHTIAIDRNPNAGPNNIVLAWSLPGNLTSIERVGLSGGTPVKFGPDVPGFPRYRPIQMAVGSKAVFLIGKEPGLTMVTENACRLLTEADGAASSKISRIAWCVDRLFVGYEAAFGSFDPKRNGFDLFASATSARARNPIDSGGSFLIRQINVDQVRGCVWLTIQDQVKPRDRTGLWRCEPLHNKYQKIIDLAADVSLTETGLLVHRNADESLAWVDHKSLQVTELPEFAHASGPRVYPQPYFVSPYTNSYQLESPTPQPHLIKVGDHLIGSNGKLFSRDGNEYPLKDVTHWRLLQRFGKGFITHYETARNTLWYVEPK